MAKRANSRYESRRSSEWLKIKIVERQEFIICGFTAGERDHFGALVLGLYDQGKLVWVGNVGTGFDQKALAFLRQQLDPLRTPGTAVSGCAQSRPRRDLGKARAGGGGEIRQLDGGRPNCARPCISACARTWIRADCVREEAGQSNAGPQGSPSPRQTERSFARTWTTSPLKFTNLNKVFYPAEGITKRDLLNYYDAVAGLILPHLKDRPLSLKRYPNGIAQQFFFQKDAPLTFAPWLRAEEIDSEPHRRRPSATSSPKTAPACCIWSTSAASITTPG